MSSLKAATYMYLMYCQRSHEPRTSLPTLNEKLHEPLWEAWQTCRARGWCVGSYLQRPWLAEGPDHSNQPDSVPCEFSLRWTHHHHIFERAGGCRTENRQIDLRVRHRRRRRSVDESTRLSAASTLTAAQRSANRDRTLSRTLGSCLAVCDGMHVSCLSPFSSVNPAKSFSVESPQSR